MVIEQELGDGVTRIGREMAHQAINGPVSDLGLAALGEPHQFVEGPDLSRHELSLTLAVRVQAG